MAYEDYIYTAELQDTCDADPNDTPTKAAGCRFIGQSEEGTTYNDNRPHLALAQNADLIKGQIDAAISITRVGVLSSFASNSFTIDPSGVAGNITLAAATTGSGDDITAGTPCTLVDAAGSFTAEMVGRSIIISGAANAADDGTFLITGFVNQRTIQYTNGASVGEIGGSFSYTVTNGIYLGNSNYSDSQPTRDILFQFLDENFNEVMVDGSEVKVLSVSGTIGSGFHTDGLLTVTLTDTVPNGNYRFKFGVPATLAKLPDDAFLTADIRGAQEGSGENQKPMWTVCAPAGGRGDYSGADAFADAVANGEERIYLKAGTYGPLTADTALTAVKYIMGEDKGAVTIQINGNYNMTDMPSGEGFAVEVTSAVANNNHVALAEGAVVRNVDFKALRLWLNSNVVVENVLCGGYFGALYAADNTYNVRVSNLLYDATDHTSGQLFYIQQGCTNLEFDNVRPVTPGSNLSTQENCILFSGPTKSKRIRFSNCYFETAGQAALDAGNAVDDITFSNCVFENDDGTYSTVDLGGNTGVIFDTCYISQLSTTSTLNNEPLQLASVSNSVFRNCVVTTAATRRAVYAIGGVYNTTFENCEFSNDSPNYPTFGLYSGARELTFNGCKFTNAATTSTGVNPSFLNDTVLERSSFSGCVFDGGFGKALDFTGAVRHVSFRDCELDNDSTSNPTIHVQAAVSNSSFENCTITQSATSTVSLNAALAVASTLGDSSFKNCKFDSSADRAVYLNAVLTRVSFEDCEAVSVGGEALYIGAATEKVRFSNCDFSSETTVVDTTSTTNGHNMTMTDCEFRNTASDWYNVPAARLISDVHNIVESDAYRNDSGIRLEDVYFVDSWSQGHDSTTKPTGGTGGGTAGFAVFELEGVTGKNVVFNRNTVTYNVQNGPWVKMTHCYIDRVSVRVENTSSMTPHTYAAGSVSPGMVEVRGHSRIKGFRYGDCLKSEVARPVMWLRADNTFGTTSPYDPAGRVTVEDVEIAFDNGSAFRTSVGEYEPLLILLARASTVKGFVWTAGCKIATRNDASSIDATASLIQLAGTHNVLERAFIRMNTGSQGTAETIIAVGDGTDTSPYGNVVRDCVLDIGHWVPASGAGTIDYPWRIINVAEGCGATVDNCNIFCRAAPNNVINVAIRMVSYHGRVSNCHVDFLFDLDSTTSAQILFDGSVDQSCTCIGNIIRARTGSTTPTIGGAAVNKAANSLQAPTATPPFP